MTTSLQADHEPQPAGPISTLAERQLPEAFRLQVNLRAIIEFL
jgi:hypothetical protein